MLLLHRLNVAHPKLHNNVKLATLDAYELNIVVKPTPFPKKEKGLIIVQHLYLPIL